MSRALISVITGLFRKSRRYKQGSLVSGKADLQEVHDVEVEDLLGREFVAPVQLLLEQCITNKTVLVTGAGGSIGSEIARQIAVLKPATLILLDICELGLYTLENEIHQLKEKKQLTFRLRSLLGTVQDEPRMLNIMTTYGVDTVYHTAALKHVSMVERNIIEGVRNNVLGTYVAAKAALKAQVSTFVLISTDKAVRPVNVMGASKRLAELVLQGFAQQKSATLFSMVRFGNALGAAGSVVPLFREQIKKGGPVTITHPDMVRYFMTISEAAQLVIQAGSLARGGDVFVLDMGEPVRILDLVRKLARMMGRAVRDENNPEGDIELCYTGPRPGEKLFEELLVGDNAVGAEHPRIMRAEEFSLPLSEVEAMLVAIKQACDRGDCEAVRNLLLNSAAGYRPNHEICDWIWQEQQCREQIRANRRDVKVVSMLNNLSE